jgi:hypothetical protein
MFQSTIIIVPGLGNSGPQHWQSLWTNQFNFIRIEQQDWETPVCADWIEVINDEVTKHNPNDVILVAHSLACPTVARWAQKFGIKIKSALLVAPVDTDADTLPTRTTGFNNTPLLNLPFKSIVVTSENDQYVTEPRARHFADCWGSEFVSIGEAGHINVASGYGDWDYGLEILRQLDK